MKSIGERECECGWGSVMTSNDVELDKRQAPVGVHSSADIASLQRHSSSTDESVRA